MHIIDVHAHILPGIDDGSRNWEESRLMLQMAYEQGIRQIIATPHYRSGRRSINLKDLAGQLQEEAEAIRPDLQIFLGEELYYHEGLAGELKEGMALTLAGTRYVLVEFSPETTYPALYQALRKLIMARYIPVLAHIERYQCLRNQNSLAELGTLDCLFQMNYSSLAGSALDQSVRWCRRQVLEERVHLLGSDMHRMDYRKPDLTGALRWLRTHIPRRQLRGLVYRNADELLRSGKQD